MKILSIIGTRPQFIKLYPICKAIRDYNANLASKSPDFLIHFMVNTGQHFDKMLSDVFIDELKIENPDYNLGVVEESHCKQVGKMIIRLEKILLRENPDFVLVYGDTNSTLAGALSAKKLNFKLAHVEAGLRSFNMKMPEEVNRVLTDKMSDILFCSTENALKNLKEEGFFLKKNNYRIYNVGDVMLDTFLFYKEIALKKSQIINRLFKNEKKNYVLVTIHRTENTDDVNRLKKILELLKKISEKNNIIFPIHPRTKKRIRDIGNFVSERFIIIDPVSYFDMIKLIENADFVITDSGGVQKEAYFLKKSCITLRKETEWVETLNRNCNFLVDVNYKKIMRILNISINKGIFSNQYYGNGSASRKIIEILSSYV